MSSWTWPFFCRCCCSFQYLEIIQLKFTLFYTTLWYNISNIMCQHTLPRLYRTFTKPIDTFITSTVLTNLDFSKINRPDNTNFLFIKILKKKILVNPYVIQETVHIFIHKSMKLETTIFFKFFFAIGSNCTLVRSNLTWSLLYSIKRIYTLYHCTIVIFQASWFKMSLSTAHTI